MRILVCDCGTSTCRAVEYDGETGKSLGRWSRPVPKSVFPSAGTEVDLDALWILLCSLLREVSEANRGPIDVVGISTFFGYTFLDAQQRPIGRGSAWMDNRAESLAREFSARVGEEQMARLTGRKLTGELLIPKLLRMAAEEPERYRRVDRVVGIKDEMVHRLTGALGTDFAHADYSGGFSPFSRAVVPELWEAAGVNRNLLPTPESAVEIAGSVTAAAADATGLRSGIPVLRGTSDGTAAMYGCGAMVPGIAAFVSGTTDVLMTAGKPATCDPALTVNTAMVGTGTLVGGAMGFSGGAAAWVSSLAGKEPYELLEAAGAVPAGANGLLMVPSLTGERSPFWNPSMHGAWIGIQTGHDAGHLYRACLEGSALRAALLIERLAAAGIEVPSLSVGGGGSRMDLWNQIRADATGRKVVVSEEPEATSRGTALLCLPFANGGEVDVERFSRLTERWLQPARSYLPDPQVADVYTRGRMRYEKVATMMNEDW